MRGWSIDRDSSRGYNQIRLYGDKNDSTCQRNEPPGKVGPDLVAAALPALLDVPFGLAVADDQEVAHGWSVNQNR